MSVTLTSLVIHIATSLAYKTAARKISEKTGTGVHGPIVCVDTNDAGDAANTAVDVLTTVFC